MGLLCTKHYHKQFTMVLSFTLSYFSFVENKQDNPDPNNRISWLEEEKKESNFLQNNIYIFNQTLQLFG